MPDRPLNQTTAPWRRVLGLAALGFLLAACGADDAPPESPSGVLLVEQGPLTGPSELVSISVDGLETTSLAPAWNGAAAGRLSPDGSQLVWTGATAEGETAIVVGDAAGNEALVIAAVDAGGTATWSRDCQRVAFSRRDESAGTRTIHALALASGETESITAGASDAEPDWSPTADHLVFTSDRGGDTDIVVLDLEDGSERQLTDNTVGDTGPRWSPDGTRIAWASRVNERKHIFVMEADGSGAIQLTGAMGGEHPVWSPDGEWIAYQQGGTTIAIMRADGTDPRALDTSGIPTDWGPRAGSC